MLAAYERDPFVRHSSVSPVTLAAWEQVALLHLPRAFEAIALAPVTPLGTTTAVTQLSQDWSVPTARNTEVVSDTTNVLALECALRRRDCLPVAPRASQTVRLAASHRVLRAQRFEGRHASSHFALFALCSAGRRQSGLLFERDELAVHIAFYLSALPDYVGDSTELRVAVSYLPDAPGPHESAEHTRGEEAVAHIVRELDTHSARPTCSVEHAREKRRRYYVGLCFRISAMSGSGEEIELADGGVVDWTQRYLSDTKERLVTSGIGSERVCQLFAPAFSDRPEGTGDSARAPQ